MEYMVVVRTEEYFAWPKVTAPSIVTDEISGVVRRPQFPSKHCYEQWKRVRML